MSGNRFSQEEDKRNRQKGSEEDRRREKIDDQKKEEIEMKKNLSIVLAALFVVGIFVSTGLAQWNTHWEKSKGVIEKVDKMKKEIVLKTESGAMTFATDQHTIISKWTQKLPWSGLKKGMPATIEYRKEGNMIVATWVDVGKK